MLVSAVRVWGLGFGVWGLEVWGIEEQPWYGPDIQVPPSEVQDSGIGIQGLRVRGSEGHSLSEVDMHQPLCAVWGIDQS